MTTMQKFITESLRYKVLCYVVIKSILDLFPGRKSCFFHLAFIYKSKLFDALQNVKNVPQLVTNFASFKFPAQSREVSFFQHHSALTVLNN